MVDLLIVGAGLFGATFASQAVSRGLKVLVIDQRAHPGGNCRTENVDGIEVHKYGPHVFHTSDRATWDYVNRFAGFLPYTHRVLARSGGALHPFPVNLSTIRAFHPEVRDEAGARALLASFARGDAADFEGFMKSRVGPALYEAFYAGYTRKQWGREPCDLPAFIGRRIPVRAHEDDRYFDDLYEGIPEGGYTALIRNMLRGAEVRLNTDYFGDKPWFDSQADTVLYTGEMDRFFGGRFGALEYRGLAFEEIRIEAAAYQERAVVNYCDRDVPWTRITEHKHFTGARTGHTIITREHPARGGGSYYPVNDAANNAVFRKYAHLAAGCENTLFGGRLAEYRYFDMDQVIQSARRKFRGYALAGFRKPPPALAALAEDRA